MNTWSPYVNAWPSSDGLGMYASIGQAGQVITPVTGLVEVPGSGPTSYKYSHTLEYAGTTDGLETFAYFYSGAFSSTTSNFQGTVIVSATTGLTTPVQIGPLDFIRYPIPISQTVDLLSANGLLKLHLEPNSLPTDAYGLVIPSTAPPGALPFNYTVVGLIYNVRASGAVVTTTQPGVLWMYYTPETLGNLDPNTLHIYWWNGNTLQWDDLGGTLFAPWQAVYKTVDRFGVYALLAPLGPIYSTYLPLIRKH